MLTRTTTRLLDDLRDPSNSGAWELFDARYRPILLAFGGRLGFGSEEAEEMAQRSLAEFVKSYGDGRYNRAEGRLSAWLIGIARHVACAMRRRRSPALDPAFDLPDENELTRVWDRERELNILSQALDRLRTTTGTDDHTLRAFDLFALRGVPAAEVARQCGISVDAVYTIKNRLTTRLRALVGELTAAFDEGP